MTGALEPYQPAAPVVVHRAGGVVHSDTDFAVSEETQQLILDGIPDNTRDAYTKQWKIFSDWCAEVGRVDLPATPETLAEFVQFRASAGKSPATISQAISAVRTIHRRAGFKDQPDIEGATAALKGHRIRWSDAGNRTKKATPILVDALRDLVGTCDVATLVGVRNRAVLVLGWALMARRSEVAALMAHDVRETTEGLLVYIAKSKTDKQAKGEEVAIAAGKHPGTDPVRVVRAWRDALAVAGVSGGRLFRSIDKHGNIRDTFGPAAVGRIVKEAAEQAGLPQAELATFHGLRAGGATDAYKNGAPISSIAKHGRWAENSPVVLGYIRGVDKWNDNPMRDIGL